MRPSEMSTIRVRVLLFGVLRERAGAGELWAEVSEHGSVTDVVSSSVLSGVIPEPMRSSCAYAVNREYAAPSTQLKAGDEVAILPPVSGGAR